MRKTLIFLLLAALLAGCVPQDAEEPRQNSGYISAEELGETAALDKGYFEPFIALSPSKMEYIYLYVVDEDGAPVKNITCFNRNEWSDYNADGGGKRSGVSMPGGLLPVPLYSYIEGSELELVLANCDSAGGAAAQTVTVDINRMRDEEIYKAVWNGETPDDSVKARADSITVRVKPHSEADFSRYIVYITGHEERADDGETAPAIGVARGKMPAAKNLSAETSPVLGAITYYEPRYMDADGTVTLAAAALSGFEQFEIHVVDSPIQYAGNVSYVFVEDFGQSEYTIEP